MTIFGMLFQGLIVEGVELEPYPCNPSIPAETGPYLVKLLCRPKSEGELHIIGNTLLLKAI